MKRPTTIKPLTYEDAIELQDELDGTGGEVQKVLHWVRNRLGRAAVEANAGVKVVEAGKELDRFYSVEVIEMEVKKGVEEEKDGKKVLKEVELVEDGKRVTKKVLLQEEAKKIKKVVSELEGKD